MSTGRQDSQSVGSEFGAHTGSGEVLLRRRPPLQRAQRPRPVNPWSESACGQPGVPLPLIAGGSGMQINSVVGNHGPASSRGTGNRDRRIRALQTRAEPSSQSEAADAKGQPEPGLIDALPVGRFLYSSMTGPGFFRTMSRSLSPFINRALSGVAHSNYITNS